MTKQNINQTYLQYTTKLKKFLNNYVTLNRLEVSNLLEYDTILIGKYLPTRPIGNHLLVNMVSYLRRQIVNTTVRTSYLALKDNETSLLLPTYHKNFWYFHCQH